MSGTLLQLPDTSGRGNFELITSLRFDSSADEQIVEFSRDNTSPTLNWSRIASFLPPDGAIGMPFKPALARDGVGRLHAIVGGGANLEHFMKDGNGWRHQAIIARADSFDYPAVVVARSGNIHTVVSSREEGVRHFIFQGNPPSWQEHTPGLLYNSTAGVGMCQSNLSSDPDGGLEVVACEADGLAHSYFDGSQWHRNGIFAPNVNGFWQFRESVTYGTVAAIIQSSYGNRGNLEVVAAVSRQPWNYFLAPRVQLVHWWRNDDGRQWSVGAYFGDYDEYDEFRSVGFIQSSFGGNFEVVAHINREQRLDHYYRDAGTFNWSGRQTFS